MSNLASAIVLPVAMLSERLSARDDQLHAQKMAALGELASGITHDFRNILQTVISTLDILESRYNDPAEVRRLTASALRASERGIGLTKRLLRFSRCDATEARPISLLASLESATETLSRTVEARMNVGVDPLPADLWQVVIDPNEFELALINLGLNARDAMANGGRIRLAARNVTIPPDDRRASQRRTVTRPAEDAQPDQLQSDRPQLDRRGPRLSLPGGDYVAISVRDTGTGMDEATMARAVEPFFTTKPVGKGTGLGLASVHTLATGTQGTLRLLSKLGFGTTVEVWLPRAPVPTE